MIRDGLTPLSVLFLVFSLSFCRGSDLQAAGFLSGEVNGQPGINITDVIYILKYLFLGARLPCKEAADVNDNGEIGIDDALHLLKFLFLAAPQPLPPYPDFCGVDPTEDSLGCEKSIYTGDGIFFVVDRSGGFAAFDLADQSSAFRKLSFTLAMAEAPARAKTRPNT